MTAPHVPPEEVQARLQAFGARLAAQGVDGAVLRGRADRFYLTGTAQEGLLWVTASGEAVHWVLRDAARARQESPVPVVAVEHGRDLWIRARQAGEGRRLGVAADALTLADARRLGKSELIDVAPDLLDLRSRKSPWEIQRIEASARVAAAVFAAIPEFLRPGVTEAALAGALFGRALALGHEGLLRARNGFEAYSWHVLSGPNTARAGAVDTPMAGEGLSPAFPTGAGRRPIQRGEPVVIDFGIAVFGYQSDQTRTFCLGPPPDWLRESHRALEAVRRALLARVAPGASVGAVFAAGVEAAERQGLAGYLGPPGGQGRFVGHGIGLETVEPPILARGSSAELLAGHVVALEPKAVVPGLGGVGMEDTVLVTPGGPRLLAPLPEELVVL